MILSEEHLAICNSFTFLSCDFSEEGQSYYFYYVDRETGKGRDATSPRSHKLAKEVLEMLDEPVLSTSERLDRIEKELKKRKRLRSGRNKK